MYLLDVVFGVADGGGANQSAILGRQHVDVYLLYLLLFVEIGNDCLGTQSDRFVGVYLSADDLGFDLHSLGRSFGLVGQTLSMCFFNSTLLLMVSRPTQPRVGVVSHSEHIFAHFKRQSLEKWRI